jgi:hypothetical protein
LKRKVKEFELCTNEQAEFYHRKLDPMNPSIDCFLTWYHRTEARGLCEPLAPTLDAQTSTAHVIWQIVVLRPMGGTYTCF